MKLKKQEDIRDCGLVILQSLHYEYFDNWLNINQLKQKAKYGKKGINVLGLSTIAKSIGIKLTPMKGNFDAFCQLEIKQPTIALIGNNIENHYILILSKKKNKVSYLDPITGQKHSITLKKFKFLFLDVVIIPEKITFIKEKVVEYNFLDLFTKFKKHFPILIFSSILTIIFSFVSPLLLKIIMDKVIPAGMKNTLLILIIGFCSLVIFGSINNGIRNYAIYKINLKINFDLFQDVNNKLSNSNLITVEKISKVDMIRRYSLIDSASLFLSATTFSIFIESGTLLISFATMLWIDTELLIIGIVGSIIISLIILSNKILVDKKYKHYIGAQLDLNSDIYDFINTVNYKKDKQKQSMSSKINKSYFKFKKVDSNIWDTNNVLGIIEEIIMAITPLMILFWGTTKVINSNLTTGSLILFLSMINHFMNPLKSLAGIIIKYPLIKKELNMLSYIRQMKLEPLNPNGLNVQEIQSIEFKEFSFGYEEGKNILNFNNFKIDSSIHLKGKNGTGKSTLFNILNFKYLPKGVFVNGVDREFYSLQDLRNLVYDNQPNDFLPKQSVIEFATNRDLKITTEFIKTITKNGVLQIMKEKNIELETTILNNGDNFSSGQKQLIKLLPLFARTYSIILIDEGLENLDIETRRKISNKIKEHQSNAKFIEISHTGKFISEAKSINIEKIN